MLDFLNTYIETIDNKLLHDALWVTVNEVPFAIWETIYVTVLSTLFAVILGLPLGVLLVAGEKNGVMPLPSWLMSIINTVINLLRSIPFLILMIMAFPLTELILGTRIGTVAMIVPLVIAAFPFVARLVESSLREINPNIIEAAESMGATPFQIIVKVMIPESVPSLISNFTIAITTVLGYSAMSGIIGGGGLGTEMPKCISLLCFWCSLLSPFSLLVITLPKRATNDLKTIKFKNKKMQAQPAFFCYPITL